jgi:hypothetical protein
MMTTPQPPKPHKKHEQHGSTHRACTLRLIKNMIRVKSSPSTPYADQLSLAAPAHAGNYRTVTTKNIGDLFAATTPWNIRLRKSALGFDDQEVNEIEECFLVVEYTLQP